jgi:hypothetical protein
VQTPTADNEYVDLVLVVTPPLSDHIEIDIRKTCIILLRTWDHIDVDRPVNKSHLRARVRVGATAHLQKNVENAHFYDQCQINELIMFLCAIRTPLPQLATCIFTIGISRLSFGVKLAAVWKTVMIPLACA